MTKRIPALAASAAAALLLAAHPLPAQSRAEIEQGMRRAAEFYRGQVSTGGGYHTHYAEDLSYGRSEHGEGPTQIEVQREATPIVGMTLLDAWHATGDRFYLDAARDAAHALVRGQLCSGGWDYLVEFDPQKRSRYRYRVDGCGARTLPGGGEPFNVTTLDDNVTQAALRLLMRVDGALQFRDTAVHQAAGYALDRLLAAQYPNGAWPQRFQRPPDPAQHPVLRASYPEDWPRQWPGAGYDYRDHYTFNDNSIADMIDAMLEAARIYDEPRYREAAKRGGDFILLAQMPDPQPGWAQQYDRGMRPAWARQFEPPSVTGGEAQGIMRILQVLYRETGDRKYLEPIPRALAYYRASALPPVATPSEHRARACPAGTKYCMARFYELRTNRPLYVTKGSSVAVLGGSTQRFTGYQLSYSDSSVITHYGVLTRGDELDAIGREQELLSAAPPASVRRPARLSGLSPWQQRFGAGPAAPPQPPAALLAALDPRGAWVEEGYIGRADRVVSVFAAEPMTVRVGGQVLTIGENDEVEVFRGAEPPRQRVLSTQTFVDNLRTLIDALR